MADARRRNAPTRWSVVALREDPKLIEVPAASACGNISVGNHVISAGLLLAGQRIHVGLPHAGKTAGDGIAVTAPRYRTTELLIAVHITLIRDCR